MTVLNSAAVDSLPCPFCWLSSKSYWLLAPLSSCMQNIWLTTLPSKPTLFPGIMAAISPLPPFDPYFCPGPGLLSCTEHSEVALIMPIRSHLQNLHPYSKDKHVTLGWHELTYQHQMQSLCPPCHCHSSHASLLPLSLLTVPLASFESKDRSMMVVSQGAPSG